MIALKIPFQWNYALDLILAVTALYVAFSMPFPSTTGEHSYFPLPQIPPWVQS